MTGALAIFLFQCIFASFTVAKYKRSDLVAPKQSFTPKELMLPVSVAPLQYNSPPVPLVSSNESRNGRWKTYI